jgi:hypothetical protein
LARIPVVTRESRINVERPRKSNRFEAVTDVAG